MKQSKEWLDPCGGFGDLQKFEIKPSFIILKFEPLISGCNQFTVMSGIENPGNE